MIVVSDTTAITTMLKCDEERLLQQLFGTVFVPGAVRNELLHFHGNLPDFIVLRAIDLPHGFVGPENLGQGETEALELAKQIHADLLLTDDKRARAAAKRLGLKCAGLLGSLVDAKRRGYTPSVRVMMEKLEKRGGLYLSEPVKAEALKLASEQ